jgi:hypothetical protein
MKSLARRVSTSAAALVLAAGTAMAVAPSASAQEDLPSDSLDNLPESSQTALVGSLGSAAIGYFFFYCPFLADDELRESGGCTF